MAQLPRPGPNSRGARSINRILEAAASLFGRRGFQGASMHAVARAAGVSKGLLHYHFQSKEHLLLEATQATFRQIHRRFDERFQRGERGLEPALEALDALWEVVRDLESWTPFMVETMSRSNQPGPIRDRVEAFYAETMPLLERGAADVFADAPELLVHSPERSARLVRVAVLGLVAEMAFAQDDAARDEVRQTYEDLRDTFAELARARQGIKGPRSTS